MELIIVTGLSGAGKSKVVDALEDIGFFCADNVPPKLIPTFAQLLMESKESDKRSAIVSDTRAGYAFNEFSYALNELKNRKIDYKILFIDAKKDILLQRFKETRRKHPLLESCNGSLEDAITEERQLLLPARQYADFIIDTSNTSVQQCKDRISEMFIENPRELMQIRCTSFGFKYGIPNDSDIVFDVRCLPNPFYIDELKFKTGLDADVREYVLQWNEAVTLLDKLTELIDYMLPLCIKEGKSQLVISIGCTGGKHRSVVFAEKLYDHFAEKKYLLSINHRDIKK